MQRCSFQNSNAFVKYLFYTLFLIDMAMNLIH